MPKFKVSATGAGGKPVGDILVEKVGREQALDEGIADLLLLDQFPPEAVQLYRESVARGYERGDIFDLMTSKWNLQFWCEVVRDEQPVPPLAEKIAAANYAAGHADAVATVPTTGNSHRLTPRQLLREELKWLNAEVRGRKRHLDEVIQDYTELKERRDECRRLLKNPPPTPKVKNNGKRNLQSV